MFNNPNHPNTNNLSRYIAILASARFHCDTLVSAEQSAFLACGGPPEWLKGVKYAPLKLQRLLEVNSLLAHQPWRIRESHISALTSLNNPNHPSNNPRDEAFSIAEIVHAFVILTSFHALSGNNPKNP